MTNTTYRKLIDNTPLVMGSLLIFDSLHFIFARMLLPYASPTTSSLYIMGLATVEVALVLGVRGKIRFKVMWDNIWLFLGIGFLVAFSTILTFTAVAFIDPGTASLLVKSSILFSVGLGVVWLRERLTLSQLLGAVVAIFGVVIITFQPGDYLQLGSLIVLSASLMYALHNALYKRYGNDIELANFFLFRLAGTTFFLLLTAIAMGEPLLPSGRQAWMILLLTATVNIVLSRTLYYLSLQRLNLSVHSIILTLSPVATIIWTLLLFEVKPTTMQLLGGVAVMAGVMMTTGAFNFAWRPKLFQGNRF